MKRLILIALSVSTLSAIAGTSHAAEVNAYCTVNSTYVSAAGETVHTPPITVPCP